MALGGSDPRVRTGRLPAHDYAKSIDKVDRTRFVKSPDKDHGWLVVSGQAPEGGLVGRHLPHEHEPGGLVACPCSTGLVSPRPADPVDFVTHPTHEWHPGGSMAHLVSHQWGE
jgi:hypothetical protein